MKKEKAQRKTKHKFQRNWSKCVKDRMEHIIWINCEIWCVSYNRAVDVLLGECFGSCTEDGDFFDTNFQCLFKSFDIWHQAWIWDTLFLSDALEYLRVIAHLERNVQTNITLNHFVFSFSYPPAASPLGITHCKIKMNALFTYGTHFGDTKLVVSTVFSPQSLSLIKVRRSGTLQHILNIKNTYLLMSSILSLAGRIVASF